MDSINLCYEMCDYIEQNGVVKLVGNVKLRDNLKKELLHFLIYISMTDGRYGEEEKAFIKKKLGFDVSASMAADIKNRNMLGAGYITRVPETFKYFILAMPVTRLRTIDTTIKRHVRWQKPTASLGRNIWLRILEVPRLR